MKNTIMDYVNPKTIEQLKQLGQYNDNRSMSPEEVLQNAQHICQGADKAHYIIRHKQHRILYWPNKKVIKLFYGTERIYLFNASHRTTFKVYARGLALEQTLLARIQNHIVSERAAQSTRKFLEQQRLVCWAKLRTRYGNARD